MVVHTEATQSDHRLITLESLKQEVGPGRPRIGPFYVKKSVWDSFNRLLAETYNVQKLSTDTWDLTVGSVRQLQASRWESASAAISRKRL